MKIFAILFIILLTLAAPFITVWTVASRVWEETRDIPFYVWGDLKDDWRGYNEAVKRIWVATYE